MTDWLSNWSPQIGQIALHSMKAIPLLLLLLILQRFALRWISPQGMVVLWFIALIRLLWPFRLSLPAGIYHGMSGAAFSRLAESPAFKMSWHAGNLAIPTPVGVSWNFIWAALWLAGVMVMLARLVFHVIHLHRRFDGLRACTESKWLELLEDVREEANVRVPISLVVHASIPAPALYGFLRPRILLPLRLATGLDEPALRSILRHEVAHVRRSDIALNWLVEIVLMIHWFNPLVWWMSHSIARVREMACDRTALERAESPRHYGHVLLQVAEIFQFVPYHGRGGWNCGKQECLERKNRNVDPFLWPVERISRRRRRLVPKLCVS